MLDAESSLLRRGEPGTGSLMTSLARAFDTHQKTASTVESDADHSPGKGLTVDGIFGDIFVINFAGDDTTANTLAFSMLLLAVYPEVQEWVSDALQEIARDGGNGQLEYGALLSMLIRCRAAMVCIHYLPHTLPKLSCRA